MQLRQKVSKQTAPILGTKNCAKKCTKNCAKRCAKNCANFLHRKFAHHFGWPQKLQTPAPKTRRTSSPAAVKNFPIFSPQQNSDMTRGISTKKIGAFFLKFFTSIGNPTRKSLFLCFAPLPAKVPHDTQRGTIDCNLRTRACVLPQPVHRRAHNAGGSTYRDKSAAEKQKSDRLPFSCHTSNQY